MRGPEPYLHFPGISREALSFYQGVFGGEVTIHTYADFGRTDGPADAVAHGILVGSVSLFAADAAPGEDTFSSTGLMLSLLGAADSGTLTAWFRALSEDGTVVDDLQIRPWGASDGQVRDKYGLLWLVGFED
jgi:PhnB protein